MAKTFDQSQGPVVVTDTGFTNACGVDWNCAGNFTISGGKAVKTAGASGSVNQIGVVKAGVLYQIDLDVDALSGIARVYLETGLSVNFVNITTTGHFTATLTSTGANVYLYMGSAGTGTFDNLVIREARTFDNDPLTFDGVDPDIWNAGGIASAEAFGSGQLNHNLIAQGIPSAEAFPAGFSGDVITDGEFNTACGVNWVCDANWTITGGVARVDTPAFGNLYQAGIIEDGKTYLIEFDFTRSAGGMTVKIGGASSGAFNTSGFKSVTLTRSGGNDRLTFEAGSTFVGTVDNVTCTPKVAGSVSVQNGLHPAGVVSAEVFGAAKMQLRFSPVGVVSAEAFGVNLLQNYIHAQGIESEEAVGPSVIQLHFFSGGIVSGEAFGETWVRNRWQPATAVKGAWTAGSGKSSVWTKDSAGDTTWG